MYSQLQPIAVLQYPDSHGVYQCYRVMEREHTSTRGEHGFLGEKEEEREREREKNFVALGYIISGL